MFLDSTTRLCALWEDGYYYDQTKDLCRQWDGTCNRNCAYQRAWFQCQVDQILDLDSLTCVNSWDSPKLLLTDAQYQFSKIWRNPTFYIDPLSSKLLEVGTINYPFRTFKSVSSEVLNHLSNKNLNLTILLKEGSKTYIEDDTTYFLGLNSVTLSTYSDGPSTTDKALLVPTAIQQHWLSGRASFNILTHWSLNINEAISNGDKLFNLFRWF
jgi:hypothetical protein